MATINWMRWMKVPARDGIAPVLEEIKTVRNFKPKHQFPTRKRDTITTENILWFFRKPRSLEQAYEFFGVKRIIDPKAKLTPTQVVAAMQGNLSAVPTIESRLHDRFALLFGNLRRKLYFSEREHPETKVVTYKSQRYKNVRRDDNQGPAPGRSEPQV